ncbi:class I SAM-dependent methyltransferase [bacterium]|nr:class I SAM-dependent methyltransferase [bacterium]
MGFDAEGKNHSEEIEAANYLHGFTATEHQRLLEQSDFLAPSIFYTGPLPKPHDKVIELGCGVGAQTRLLCGVDPTIQLVCVDNSQVQLSAARSLLGQKIDQGQVNLLCADAAKTGLSSETFDLAYLCWILEHASRPEEIVREAFRLLKPGGVVWITEVFNSSLQIFPSLPVFEKYWQTINKFQRGFQGNPDIGLQLPHMLLKAGFVEVQAQPIVFFFAAHKPKEREDMLNYWQALMLSALPAMLKSPEKAGFVPSETELISTFDELRKNPDSVFFYHPIRCLGKKPV